MKMRCMISQRLYRVATIALLICFIGCGAAPRWMQGTWQGTGLQIDGQQWQVSLDASNLAKVKISYPDLSCGGEWKIGRKSAESANMRERLTYGLDNCDQNVEVVVERPVNGNMKLTFYLKSYAADPIATAILSRANGN